MPFRYHFTPQTPDQQRLLESELLNAERSGTLILPTGAGKSALAWIAILNALTRQQKAIYLAPTKGVLGEQYRRWREVVEAAAPAPELEDQQMSLLEPAPVLTGYVYELEAAPVVGLFDADHPAPLGAYGKTDFLLMTPERLDLCLRHPSVQSQGHWIKQVGLCVIDEVQTIQDGHRGARLEGALLRLRWLRPECRWLALSADVNPQDQVFLDWVGGWVYHSTVRPVPQVWRILTYSSKAERDRQLIDLLKSSPYLSLVFVSTRKLTESLAQQLRQAEIRAMPHHAGLSAQQRQQAEELFRTHQIQAIVATGTLSVGVNLPARQVVIYDLYRPNGAAIAAGATSFADRFIRLSRQEVNQLGGRAGRPGLDQQGDVVVLAQEGDTWVSDLLPKIGEQQHPICSALALERSWLIEQLLALIAGDYCRDVKGLESILKTSLAVQTGLDLDLEDLMARLVRGRMVQGADEQIMPTDLGQTCSIQYLMPVTALKWLLSLEQIVMAQENPAYLDWLALLALSPEVKLLGGNQSLNYSRSLWLKEQTAASRLHCLQDPDRLLMLYGHAELLRTHTRSLGQMEAVQNWAGTQGLRLYGADLMSGVENAVRLSEALGGVVQTLKAGLPTPTPTLALATSKLQVLKQMLLTGLDSHQVALTLLERIGPKRAMALRELGLVNLEQVAQADPPLIAQVNGVTLDHAQKLVIQAQTLQSQIQQDWFKD